MIAAGVQWADPGPLGFAVGGLLILLAAGLLWLRFSRRRLHAEAAAEVGGASTPGRLRACLPGVIAAFASALAVWLLSTVLHTQRMWPGVITAFVWTAGINAFLMWRWGKSRVADQPTQVVTRTADTPDATAVLPRVRGVRRG